ncbi:hypothetical protein GCM10018987_07810 [Streptomyces cremeus]
MRGRKAAARRALKAGGDEPAQAQVFGAVHLGHGPHVRNAVLRYVRAQEAVGADPEAGVAEEGAGVGVAREGPHSAEAGGGEVDHGGLLAGAAVGGEGVAKHVGVGEQELGDGGPGVER